MPNHLKMILCWLWIGSWVIPAAGQTDAEVRPEVGLYLQQGQLFRIEFVDTFIGDESTHDWQGNFAFYVNAALKPVFRRELRDRPDVFRDKYLALRTGYQHQTSFTNSHSATENRGVLELTSRYMFPWQLVIVDRNRGEFRFIEGQSFSTRYRNRLRLERDVKYGWFNCTPYAYDEIFYDTRYDRWTPNRYALGAEFPAGSHVVLGPYYLRQNGSRSNPPRFNAFGFKLNLYY